ncbi:hypothetical protein [Streptomyces sp. NPDC056492]|uniref:hypothetical protein n=1 Tax=unclassified Streptomyces TaxID=2593676 RepID=UPI00367D6D74
MKALLEHDIETNAVADHHPRAHLSGTPVPPLPQNTHSQDLPTDAEVAAITGLTACTVRADATAARLAADIELQGQRRWTRTAAEARADRPTQDKGRTPGARDRMPLPHHAR